MKISKLCSASFERLAWFGLGFVLSVSYLDIFSLSEPKETELYRNHTDKDVFHLATHPRNLIHQRSVRIPQTAAYIKEQENNSSILNTRRFSHFRCSGDEKSTSRFKTRLCVFENTCYNTLTNNIEYYIRPDSPQVYEDTLFKRNQNNKLNFFKTETNFV